MTRPLTSARGWILRRVTSRLMQGPAMTPLRRDGLDPVAELGELRRKAPISRLTRILGTNVWLVAGYEEAKGVLADHGAFSNDIRPLVGRTNATGPEAIGGLGSTDTPDHTKLRKL